MNISEHNRISVVIGVKVNRMGHIRYYNMRGGKESRWEIEEMT